MCWVSYKPPVKKIAKKDILVYKFVNIRSYLTNRCISFFFNFTYILDMKYNTYIEIRKVGKGERYRWAGHEGFHSYYDKKTALLEYELYKINKFTSIVKCIIPKGSEYYINEENEIISNSIIILSKKSFLQKLLNYLNKCKNKILG